MGSLSLAFDTETNGMIGMHKRFLAMTVEF